MLLKVFIRKTFRKTSLFPHLFTLDFNRTTDSQLGACLQKPLNTENPNSAFSPWVAVSITGQGVSFGSFGLKKQGNLPALHPEGNSPGSRSHAALPAVSWAAGWRRSASWAGRAEITGGQVGLPASFSGARRSRVAVVSVHQAFSGSPLPVSLNSPPPLCRA